MMISSYRILDYDISNLKHLFMLFSVFLNDFMSLKGRIKHVSHPDKELFQVHRQQKI